ncbi:MAG: glycosyltransferase family 39 protein [Phycisphaerae bacterium]|nr:glycosyltransferase family 39 protein [Phycisphaerae bacterium]
MLVRCGWSLAQGSPQPATDGLVFPDEQVYWALAQSMAAGNGLIDEFGFRATYMPLYPAFLSLFVNHPHGLLLGRLCQCVLGGLAVVPVFLLARQLAGTRTAWIAALLMAIDPFFVFGFSHRMLTETIFITLFCLAIWLAWPARSDRPRRDDLRSIIVGLVFGACIYLRPSTAGFALAWLVVTTIVADRTRHAVMLRVQTLAVIVMCLIPWATRNRIVIDEWQPLTTRSGISLYDGLGPRAAGGSDLAYTKTMPELRHLPETQWRDWLTEQSLKAARGDPARTLHLACTKFKRTWAFIPNEPGSRTPMKMAVSAVWMAGVLMAAVWGACRMRPKRVVLFLLLPAIYFTLLHMIFVGSIRYRIPAMPLLYILAGAVFAARNCRRSQGAANA